VTCRRKNENESAFFLIVLLNVLLVGCAVGNRHSAVKRNTDPASVVNKTWQWQGTVTPVDRITVPQPERYTIRLTSEGRVQAVFDCNRGGGDYEMTEGRLTFGPLLSTRMACPPDTQDEVFMRDLQRVQSFFVENGELFLELTLG